MYSACITSAKPPSLHNANALGKCEKRAECNSYYSDPPVRRFLRDRQVCEIAICVINILRNAVFAKFSEPIPDRLTAVALPEVSIRKATPRLLDCLLLRGKRNNSESLHRLELQIQVGRASAAKPVMHSLPF